jgi:hypothetical protein
MKTKNTRSPGSLLLRGTNYYAFWRVKGTDGKNKAISRPPLSPTNAHDAN